MLGCLRGPARETKNCIMASGIVKVYLLAYNGLLSLGWLIMLLPAIRYTATHTDSLARMDGYVPGLYNQIRLSLLVIQTAAVMEVNSVRPHTASLRLVVL